jgi:S1-C subfamily serine protease
MPELAERNGLFDPRVARGPRRPEPEAELELESEPKSDYGLVVRTPDQELTEKYKLGKTSGVVVTAVDADSQLAEYGFQVGDLIFEVDKKPVKTSAQFAEILKDATAKKKFTVRYQRSGEKLSAVVLNESGSTKEKPSR